MNRWRTPHRPVTCQHCRGKSGHPPIDGEGVAVCLPCVYRLGRKVAEASVRLDMDEAAVQRRLAALGISYPDDEVAA